MDVDLESSEIPDEGAPPWMATFSDMATLLLTFFVLLLSFANMDVKNFRMALGSVKDALGVPSSSSGTYMALSSSLVELSDRQSSARVSMFDSAVGGLLATSGVSKSTAVQDALRDYLESLGVDEAEVKKLLQEAADLLAKLGDGVEAVDALGEFLDQHGFDAGAAEGIYFVAEQRLRQREADRNLVDGIRGFLHRKGLESVVDVAMSPRGVVVRLSDRVLFDSGRDRLKPEAPSVLDVVAQLAIQFPETLSVEGHTDSRPINTWRFPSNWELSTARAVRVLRYLTAAGISSSKLRVAGYGAERPVAPNDTTLGRARNRRVEFVFERRGMTGHRLQRVLAGEREPPPSEPSTFDVVSPAAVSPLLPAIAPSVNVPPPTAAPASGDP